MDVATQLEYFRKEHQDFLRFLKEWEEALETTASKNPDECVKGLTRLRELEPNLNSVRDHCDSEERSVEAPHRDYLEKGRLEELKNQHQELRRLIADMFSELRFATIFQTERACSAGRELVAFTRRHIEFEEKLLGEIERKLSDEAEQKLLLRYTQAPE